MIDGENLAERPPCDVLPACDQGVTPYGKWVYARNLVVGDAIQSRSRQSVKITSLEFYETEAVVYNFQVGDLHTYAVGCDAVLVHNTNGPSDATTPRKSSKNLRKEWEEANGQPWPKDTNNPTRNQDVSHKKPLADGGTNHIDNIEPCPHKDHVQHHIDNGDFVRWGKRAIRPETNIPGE